MNLKKRLVILLCLGTAVSVYAHDTNNQRSKMRYAKFFGIGIGTGIAAAGLSTKNQAYAQENPGIKAVHDQYGSKIAPAELAKFLNPQVCRSMVSLGVATAGKMSLIDFKNLEDIDPAIAHVYKEIAGQEVLKNLIGEPDAVDYATFFAGDATAQVAFDAVLQKIKGEPLSFKWNPSMIFALSTMLYIGINRYMQEPVVKVEPKNPVSRSWFSRWFLRN